MNMRACLGEIQMELKGNQSNAGTDLRMLELTRQLSRTTMVPIPAVLLTQAVHLARLAAAPGGRAAVGGLHQLRALLQVARLHLGRRVAKAVAVAGLHHRQPGPDRLHKSRTRRAFAAVVGHQQPVGLQVFALQQGLLSTQPKTKMPTGLLGGGNAGAGAWRFMGK